MTTTVSSSHAPNTPASSSSFATRLRRLSQFRPHSNSHQQSQPSHPTHSSLSYFADQSRTRNPRPDSRSYRNRLSWVVGLSSSPPANDSAAEYSYQDPDFVRSRRSASVGQLHPRPGSSSNRDSVLSRSDGSGSESSNSEAQSNLSSTSSRSSQPNNPVNSHRRAMVGIQNTSTTDGAAARTQNSSRIPTQQNTSQPPNPNAAMNENSSSTQQQDTSNARNSTASQTDEAQQKQQATIRFFSHQDPLQNSRPSLPFSPMTRTLPDESCVIRVGRYSERDGIPLADPAGPSAAPVGFKSKVVSRKHCEFSFIGGLWHVRDVGSSSGTFLNHMRLSQPGISSRQYAVRDGDIVQLGIDFRGGEEMIFRCVRIRIECNRMWQRRPNEFNKNTESLINNLGKGTNGDYAGCRECSICLGSVLRPYQCLFMAACAHVWHYKCIRRLIHSPEYPMFQCPNCRAYTDLNAEVDDSNDTFDDKAAAEPPSSRDHPVVEMPNPTGASNTPSETDSPSGAEVVSEVDNITAAANNIRLNDSTSGAQDERLQRNSNVERSSNINIPAQDQSSSSDRATRNVNNNLSAADESPSLEDPLTPRNDQGPLAFDGRAGRL